MEVAGLLGARVRRCRSVQLLGAYWCATCHAPPRVRSASLPRVRAARCARTGHSRLSRPTSRAACRRDLPAISSTRDTPEIRPRYARDLADSAPRATCQLFKTDSKGWGVKSSRGYAEGELVIEYVGEVRPPTPNRIHVNLYTSS